MSANLAEVEAPAALEFVQQKARRGRPPGPVEGSMTARVEIRMTEAQREKLQALGGTQWLRDKIDGGKLPKP